jgi:hypothetical protein
MEKNIRYLLGIAMVCGVVSATLCVHPAHSRMYRIISSKVAFDRLVGSKKYALVLFYTYDKRAADTKLTEEERGAHAKSVNMLRRISEDPKYAQRNDLIFIEVNLASKDGPEIYNRYSSAFSLPSYIALIDGKEAKDWGLTFSLSGANINEENIEKVLDRVLQK